MPVLSDDQLAALLRRAHVGAGDASYLVAISHPESGADSSVVQQGQPYATTGWGLWQITPGNSEPQFGINQALLNPQSNADAAAAKLRSQGLGAWTTYTSGLYQPYFGAAKTAVARVYGMSQQQVDQLAQSAGHGTRPSSSVPGGPGAQTTGINVPGIIQKIIDPFSIQIPFLEGAGQSVGDVGTAVAGLANVLATFEHWMAWLFVPSHWVRIICGVLGVPLVGVGILTMTKGAQPIPVNFAGGAVGTEVSGGSMAPALGIAEVTAGAILLFIAFHNLPDNVQTFPQLLSHIQAQVQGTGTSSTPAGPKPTVT